MSRTAAGTTGRPDHESGLPRRTARYRLDPAFGRWKKRLPATGILLVAMLGAVGYANRGSADVARAASGISAVAGGGGVHEVLPRPAPTPSVLYGANGVPLAVSNAVAAAGGDTAVAVYDATSGRSYAYQDSARFKTGSVVKLSILGELLRRAQEGRTPTAADQRNALAMIAHSDNDAASDLWDELGRGSAVVGTFDRLVGTRATTADPGGYLGLTVTTAADEVMVMRAIAYPNPVLTDSSRAQAVTLLGQVESDQRFGATAGVPPGVEVDVKNGWLPYDEGWYVNTVAHVYGAGRDYVVAVMSKGGATQQAGTDRIEQISAAVWQTAGIRR